MVEAAAGWAADDLGPAKVVFLRPCAGVEAVVVIDNVALGPAIGGVRMRPDVTAGEVARLARAMTVKNAVAGLKTGRLQEERQELRRDVSDSLEAVGCSGLVGAATTPPSLHAQSCPQRTAHAGLMPAATSTSAGATNPVAVSKVLSVSATSAHAATRTASGQSLTTAR